MKMKIIPINGHEKKEIITKPYVRYKIDGEVHDKGGAYAVKTAILNHIKNRNLNWRLINFVPTSSHLSALLEISDYTQLDVDIPELLHSINESGRQPSKPAYRAKLTIEPVPFEAYVENEIRQQYEEQLGKKEHHIKALSQECEEQQKIMREKNMQYTKLEDSCKEHQLLLTGKDREISSLESKLEKLSIRDTNSLVKTLLEGYVAPNEVIFEVVENYLTLKNNDDVDLFIKFEGEMPTYLNYLNSKYNKSFFSEEEILSKIKEADSLKWEETEEGKNLLDLKKKYSNDLSFLELAKRSELSYKMIDSIRGVVEMNNLAGTDQSLESYQKKLQAEKKVYEDMKNSKLSYTGFYNVCSLSEQRRNNESKLPLLAHLSGFSSLFKIYAPIFDKGLNLHQSLQEIFQRSFPENKLSCKCLSDNVAEFSLNIGEKYKPLSSSELIKSTYDSIKNNDILKVLGVRLDVNYALGIKKLM